MAERKLALDTSVAVPYLMSSHASHASVRQALAGSACLLLGHAAVETYSVLTRLPADARLAAADAASLLAAAFPGSDRVRAALPTNVVDTLANLGITGGAVYDALVGMAAGAAGVDLATRDARARPTYALIGVRTVVLPS